MNNSLKNIAFIYVFLTCLSACKTYEVITPTAAFKKITQRFPKGDTSSSYRLNTLLDFEWDRFIIIGSYQGDAISASCDYKFALSDSKNQNTEGGDEYIFLKDKKLIKHIIYNSSEHQIIALNYDRTFDRNDRNICGFANTDRLYIQQTASEMSNWRTFKIFEK